MFYLWVFLLFFDSLFSFLGDFFKISLIGQKLIQRLLVCYVCDESSNFPNGSLFFPISSDFQIVSFLHSGWSWKQFWKQSSVISSCKNLHITLHLTVWVLINVRLQGIAVVPKSRADSLLWLKDGRCTEYLKWACYAHSQLHSSILGLCFL